jgi:C1A family cysteine protease
MSSNGNRITLNKVRPEPKKDEEKSSIVVSPILETAVLPDHYKNKNFNYHFHDKIGHAKVGGPVRLLHDAHPLRAKLTVSPITLFSFKHASKFKASYPSAHSLRNYVDTILNQGDIGACVSHSAVQALRILMNKTNSSRSFLSRMTSSGTSFWGSRLYIYDNARRIDGTPLTEDVGTTNISACVALDQYKVCSEDIWPYSRANMITAPPHDAYVTASTFKVFEYSTVDSSPEAFKAALNAGFPIMIGIAVFPSFIHSGLKGSDGVVPMPNESRETPVGGHSMLAVGYNDDTRLITVLNSWGSSFGDKGFVHLPYEFLFSDKYAGDFVAIENFA